MTTTKNQPRDEQLDRKTGRVLKKSEDENGAKEKWKLQTFPSSIQSLRANYLRSNFWNLWENFKPAGKLYTKKKIKYSLFWYVRVNKDEEILVETLCPSDRSLGSHWLTMWRVLSRCEWEVK